MFHETLRAFFPKDNCFADDIGASAASFSLQHNMHPVSLRMKTLEGHRTKTPSAERRITLNATCCAGCVFLRKTSLAVRSNVYLIKSDSLFRARVVIVWLRSATGCATTALTPTSPRSTVTRYGEGRHPRFLVVLRVYMLSEIGLMQPLQQRSLS